jgi:hypothetical protein
MYTFTHFSMLEIVWIHNFIKKINKKIKIYIDTHLFPQKIETRILGEKMEKKLKKN